MNESATQHLIGDYTPVVTPFPSLEQIFQEFTTDSFLALSPRKRFKRINQILLTLIQKTSFPCFLLPSVVDFMTRINNSNILATPFTLSLFEFWLNHFSKITPSENALVRAKIMGKTIPREEYEVYFPIGTGAVLPGSHFVAAHLSPDIDTTISSFWGWCDAFAARVAEAQHLWCLPGGPPKMPMVHIFYDVFGPAVFDLCARTAPTITMTAQDLVTNRNFTKAGDNTAISTIDHGINEKAIIHVDEQGYYSGDWRSSDVELVRQVIVLFKSCLHWFENNLHIRLISLFSDEVLHTSQIPDFLASIFEVKIGDSEPAEEFNPDQKRDLDAYLTKVLLMPDGLQSSYAQLSRAMTSFGVYDLSLFFVEMQTLAQSPLFDEKGLLRDDRTSILNYIEKVIIQLDIAIHCVRNFVERLDMVMNIKKKVVAKIPDQYITLRTDIEDIRLKMKNYDYLTVIIKEDVDKLFPVGVVWARQLRKPPLGSISMRDFSNFEEVRMADYLSVISVIDHHRTSVKTPTTPLAIIGDAQSSNTLVAQLTMQLNNKFSMGGLDASAVAAQRSLLQKEESSTKQMRLLQRLYQKELLAAQQKEGFVDPKREIAEYYSFLYGILDDTDLLTKVTTRDVECVAELLNRLKTLLTGKESEIVDFSALPRNEYFPKAAAQVLLRQRDFIPFIAKYIATARRI